MTLLLLLALAAAPEGAPPPRPGPSGEAAKCPQGMAFVPGGRFTMDKRGDAVAVAGFCLDLTEVTAEAYAACVAQGRCTAAGLSEPNRQGRERCNAGVKGRGQHPINCVGWAQAGAYCKAQGKRLPAEAEWELAARGGGAKANRFPWGDAEPVGQLCWRRAEQGTCPVGSHPQGDSALGFKDLAGNVEEWVEDRYGSVQPDRVTRGGGFPQDDAGLLCAGCRSWSGPEEQDDRIGFRCASAATPP